MKLMKGIVVVEDKRRLDPDSDSCKPDETFAGTVQIGG
jgi:hypothetical protein